MSKKISKLFSESPTRPLEEVEKVNSKDRIERTAGEFQKTESSEKVLKELSQIIDSSSSARDSRFLYIHATFGSGKTLLLKLAGAMVDNETDGNVKQILSDRSKGFRQLRNSAESSDKKIIPVFLNLLERDTQNGENLNFLIYRAIAKELGYPTDIHWLIELIWQLDIEKNIWEDLSKTEVDGKDIEEALEDRATLRNWLYKALPNVSSLNNSEEIKEKISEAENSINKENFDNDFLVNRIEDTITHLEKKNSGEYEILLGIDEIALYVGDSKEKYTEFKDLIEKINKGPNIPVVGTGQWSLKANHEEFIGRAEEGEWYTNEVGLEAADTAEIARKRWLEKDRNEKEILEELLENQSYEIDLGKSSLENRVEAYPFRDGDLKLIRKVMEKLYTKDRASEHEYAQSRAILVLVRSLFTKFDWGEKETGSIVPWNTVFDLLNEETTLIPGWLETTLGNIESNFGQKGKESLEGKIAKTLYLIEKLDDIPATKSNLASLLVDSIDTDLESFSSEIEQGLENLEGKHYIADEEDKEGRTVYRLLSEEELEVAQEIEKNKGKIAAYQLQSKIEDYIKSEGDSTLWKTEGKTKERDIGTELGLPIRNEYSITENINSVNTNAFDSIVLRLIASEDSNIEEKINQWEDLNHNGGQEDLAVAVSIPDNLKEKISRHLATERVISNKSGAQPQLRSRQKEEEKDIQKIIRESLKNADVYGPEGRLGSTDEIYQFIENRIEEKLPNRKSLTKPLRESDDAKQMRRFFKGKDEWPLGKEDAEMLGIEKMLNKEEKIKDSGWVHEVLDRYGDKNIITGEELWNQIRGNNGDYLGTSRDALKALIIVIVTSDKAALKKDGEYIIEPREIGQNLKNKRSIKEITLHPGESIDQSQKDKIRELFRTLQYNIHANDIDELVRKLEDWARENNKNLKKVNKSLKTEISEYQNIDHLIEALEPAFNGETLDKDRLADERVLEEADRYKNGEKLFTEPKEFWKNLTEQKQALKAHYPSEELNQEIEETINSGQVPKHKQVEELIERARNFRQDKIIELAENLLFEEKSRSTVQELIENLNDSITDNKSEIKDNLSKIESHIPNTELQQLGTIIDREVTEEDVSSHEIRSEAEKYYRAVKLLEENLWQDLEETYDELSEEHPDSKITREIKEIVEKGVRLPTVEEAQKLLEDAEEPENSDDQDEDENQYFEEVWETIQNLEEDSIVVIKDSVDTE
ncbi:MAG: hypothetical protein ABEJ83_01260 [Candidatus Nanohaloarchaea archaeon]